MRLEGKVAIVTGGGQGIGRGIVHCLAEEGADVAVVDILGDNAKKVADEVRALSRKSLAIEADLTDSKRVTQVIQETIDTLGKIDILVNNAGGMGKIYAAKTSMVFTDQENAEWDEVLKLNLMTQVSMCRAVAPYFIKQKSGKIVNIASDAARGPAPREWMVYGASKIGIISLTRSLAVELAEYNVNVNCICPGIIYTPLWEKIASRNIQLRPEAKGMTPREFFEKFVISRVPLKREQTAEDIGHEVAFLASEDSRNVTGQTLNVDGGVRMS